MGEKTDPAKAMRDLQSVDPETATRAAETLYSMPGAAEWFGNAEAAEAVAQSVARNNRTASTTLLLGYSPAGKEVLQRLLRLHGEEAVKLKAWSRTVPLRVAANAALSRLGDREARLRLLEEIPGFQENIRVFLLDILPYIDAPEIWHALSGYLNDTQEIPEGVPSGAARRRLCDYAADAFVDRFALPVTFERKQGGQYGPQELTAVADAFRQRVPM